MNNTTLHISLELEDLHFAAKVLHSLGTREAR